MTTALSAAASLADVTQARRQELDRFLEAAQPAVMGPRLAAALRIHPSACHVLDAKFQPGVGATVLYRLGARLVRGDLVTPAQVAAQPGARVVAPGVSVSVFPADPDLPALRSLMDPDLLSAALSRTLPRGQAPPADGRSLPGRLRVTLLRYRPAKRATVLARFPGRQDGLVVKAYHDGDKAAAVAAEAAALEGTAEVARELRFAPTTGHLPQLAAVVQRRVEGIDVAALLDRPHGPGVAAHTAVRRAATAVAELHDTSPATARRRPVDRELQRFRQRALRVQQVDPRNGDALLVLAERLLETAPRLPEPEIGTVHGDCKPSQFLVGRYVHLLDVDHLGVSDLATDVGTFVASLRQVALRRGLSSARTPAPSAYDALADTFVATYLSSRRATQDGAEEQLARITFQEAVALQRKALRAFARAPRSPLVTALTAQAHRRLDVLGGSHGHR